MDHSVVSGTSISNSTETIPKVASLSDLQETVKQLANMCPVDDTLWMNEATCDSLLAQLDAKPGSILIWAACKAERFKLGHYPFSGN
jgi:hypothetical protein